MWHDMYEGGWQTIAPTGGFPGEYMGAEIGQHNESALMPWDCQIVTDTPERVSAKILGTVVPHAVLDREDAYD